MPLTSNPVAELNRDYAYDLTLDTIRRQGQVGNRTSHTQGTAAAVNYCANELNQYESADDDASDCPPTGGADESFTYDADGNVTQDGTYDYTWDAENRLTSVTPRSPVNGSKKVEYKYDYLGRTAWAARCATGSGSWSVRRVIRT